MLNGAVAILSPSAKHEWPRKNRITHKIRPLLNTSHGKQLLRGPVIARHQEHITIFPYSDSIVCICACTCLWLRLVTSVCLNLKITTGGEARGRAGGGGQTFRWTSVLDFCPRPYTRSLVQCDCMWSNKQVPIHQRWRHTTVTATRRQRSHGTNRNFSVLKFSEIANKDASPHLQIPSVLSLFVSDLPRPASKLNVLVHVVIEFP